MNTSKVHQKADFANKTIFVGMDTHKKSWSVALYYEQTYLRSFTQPPSVSALSQLLKRDYPGAKYICGYESGLFGFWIQREMEAHGITCNVFHATDIPKSGKMMTSKRDSSDAKNIGQALSSGLISPIYVPSPEVEQDRSLVRYRERLIRDINRCKVRIKCLLFQFGIIIPEQYKKSWSKGFFQWLSEIDSIQGSSRLSLNHMIEQLNHLQSTLLEVNRDIKGLQKSEKYKQSMDLLLSIPGIGPLSAITIIVEVADIFRFQSFRQLNSFVGLYPMEYSSGEHEYKGKMTIRKNKTLRKLLIECGWVAIKHDPALALVFDELKVRMTAKRAITRIARKLLSRIHHVLITKTLYEKGIIK